MAALCCNELSQAVLTRSPASVNSILRRYPESVNERNALGQTPLHLSILWPEGLRMMLDAGASLDEPDTAGMTAVYYACTTFGIEQIEILSEANCQFGAGVRLLQFAMQQEVVLCRWAFHNLDAIHLAAAMVDKIAYLTAKRLRTLMGLVEEHLGISFRISLRSSEDGVLDYKAKAAVDLLETKLAVPEHLKNLTHPNATIYHNIYLSSRQARSLWDAGFHDVDELNEEGLSPLMLCYRWMNPVDDPLEGMKFLLSKGANVHKRAQFAFRASKYPKLRLNSERTKVPSSSAAIHYIAAHMGRSTFWRRNRTYQRLRKMPQTLDISLLRNIILDPLQDTCDCACSDRGCRAICLFLKNRSQLCPYYAMHGPQLRETLPSSFATVDLFLHVFVDIFNVDCDDPAWIRSDVLRFLTFQELRLLHTCCTPDGRPDEGVVIAELAADEQDRREIRLEQADRVEMLETLLEEFETKFGELGLPLHVFLRGYWKERMREVRRERHPTDTPGLRDLGVGLHEEEYASSVDSGMADSVSWSGSSDYDSCLEDPQ
ncbi:MAG: hypothetical protein M1822_004269 [Bathelium mastoideum]|nr:MAG: hypothetical protein M1822_004269 [Bathelium mastoideum]